MLKNPAKGWDRPAYTQVTRGGTNDPFLGYSVRTERWRYTEWDNGKRSAELYDHEKDPRELTNLAREEKYARVVRDMRKLLEKSKGR